MELESAVERLYADESLAADADDATAQPLLKWAEAQLPGIIARSGDDGFDDAFVTLKKLVKSVARLIDGRGEMDESERAERMEKIQAFAQEIGVPVDIALTGDFTAQSGPAIVAQVLAAPAAQAAAAIPQAPAAPPEIERESQSAPAPADSAAPVESPAAPAEMEIAPAEESQQPQAAPPSIESIAAADTPAAPAEAEIAPQDAAQSETDTPPSTLQSGIQSFFQRVADALNPAAHPGTDDTKE